MAGNRYVVSGFHPAASRASHEASTGLKPNDTRVFISHTSCFKVCRNGIALLYTIPESRQSIIARRHGVTGAPEVSEWVKGPSGRPARVTGAIRDGIGHIRRDRPVT